MNPNAPSLGIVLDVVGSRKLPRSRELPNIIKSRLTGMFVLVGHVRSLRFSYIQLFLG